MNASLYKPIAPNMKLEIVTMIKNHFSAAKMVTLPPNKYITTGTMKGNASPIVK